MGEIIVEAIIPIIGNVQHSITLDPSVWIFDDRRIDLTTYFTTEQEEVDEDEEYKKSMGKHWSREIMEGATFPPTLKTEKRYEKNQMLTGTFGISMHYFIQNARPKEDAETVTFETSDNEQFTYSLSEAKQFIFKYSENGKPLKEDGPVHILLKDGSNLDNPIRNIVAIRVN